MYIYIYMAMRWVRSVQWQKTTASTMPRISFATRSSVSVTHPCSGRV